MLPYDQHQPYQQPHDYARFAAATRSYTTPAVITMLLYCLFWLPGLIANIVYLSNAADDKHLTEVEPQGRGCLVALLVVFCAFPLLACLGFFGLTLLGALASS